MPDNKDDQDVAMGSSETRVSDELNERTKEIGQQQQGQAAGQAPAPARETGDDKGPSNSGNAGFGSSATEAQNVSEDRIEQMSHADGSDKEPDPEH
jgi:hypothetical protein